MIKLDAVSYGEKAKNGQHLLHPSLKPASLNDYVQRLTYRRLEGTASVSQSRRSQNGALAAYRKR